MSALEPIDLPETALIIGDRFPTQDETAYAREAEAHRVSARQASDSATAVLTSGAYTDDEFRGEAGGALAETLRDKQYNKHNQDNIRHTNVAALLDRGAGNVKWAKIAMNDISSDYHSAYDDLSRRVGEETWTQSQFRTAKEALVAEAQDRVQAVRAEFDEKHKAIAEGIAQASAATPTTSA